MKSQGFTIVELLIVVVVIAILAAITIVSYNGITRQAEESAMKPTLRTAANKLALEHTTKGAYPADIDHLNLDSGSYDLRYIRTDGTYCVEASSETRAYAVSGISGETRDGMIGMTGGTGNGAQYNNRRTLTLTNGEVIWDLSGNVREWTDATIQGGQPGSSTAFTWQEWLGISS